MCNYSLPFEVEAKRVNLASMDRKLTLIRRAQEEQQRKLITMEFKLNYVLSKMIHLTHVKPNKEELSLSLEQWQSNSNKLEQQINKLQLSLERRDEHDKKLEELLASSQLSPQLKVVSDAKLEMPMKQISNESKLLDHEYVQPAKAGCFELDVEQRIDGVYKFLEPELNEVQRDFNERYCAFATDGVAWTVIQRRSSNNNNWENFNRGWDEYRTGFGNLSKDFWFGNEFIHKIAYRDDYILRIELEDHNGLNAWAEYGLFRLDSESFNYQLVIGELNENSTTPDALTYHNRMDFRVTVDDEACAGWWLDDRCLESKSNLNGQRIIWNNWHNEYSLNASRMLIRPLNISPADITDDSYDEDSS
ncbi:hypothetical protein ACLKA6_016042 [Drosophila palustris]